MATYNVIGLMSGSSLDGLDITYCRLEEKNGDWSYKILNAECVPFDHKWRLRLQGLVLQNGVTYLKTLTFFGHYIGELVKAFIEKEGIKSSEVDFISSHGQTIFHQPENRLTSQIGDGAAIAFICNIPVVSNFRTADTARGGQGAPITPIADLYFFKEYAFCLNLGGIGNISYKVSPERIIAFDNCGVNLILNALAEKLDAPYDKDGAFAASGKLDDALLNNLNESWYFEKPYPKSLSAGWVSKIILPLIEHHQVSFEDKLHTVCEHIGMQIGKDIKHIYEVEGVSAQKGDKLLVTGGGGFNTFLVDRIKAHTELEVIVPDNQTVEFKEALLMSLMGALRVRNEVNCLSSVTGASEDTVGGIIYPVLGRGMSDER